MHNSVRVYERNSLSIHCTHFVPRPQNRQTKTLNNTYSNTSLCSIIIFLKGYCFIVLKNVFVVRWVRSVVILVIKNNPVLKQVVKNAVCLVFIYWYQRNIHPMYNPPI